MSGTTSDPTGGAVHIRSDPDHRGWVARAVRLIDSDLQRGADTHLLRSGRSWTLEPGPGRGFVAEPWSQDLQR